jgi:hypothetical protein
MTNFCDIVFQWGKSCFWGLPFCIFVRNRIYVLEVKVLELVIMASKHKFLKAGFLAYILNVSAIFRFWANHKMLDSP